MAIDEHPADRGGEHHLINYRVGKLEDSQEEFRGAIKSIDSSLRVLADMQRRLDSLADTEARVRAIEAELPTLKLTRKWVLTMMTSSGAAVGAGVMAMVMHG